jgi:hypothetical protein
VGSGGGPGAGAAGGETPLRGDPSFVDDSIRAVDEWLAVVEADDRDVPLARRIIDAKDEAGIAERCVAADGADVRSRSAAAPSTRPSSPPRGSKPAFGGTASDRDAALARRAGVARRRRRGR